MPKAAVRFTVRSGDVNDAGVLTPATLRRLRHLLWDAPATSSPAVDLGPCRLVDRVLVRELAALPCAASLLIEAEDWRVAEEAAEALNAALRSLVAP